MNLRASSKDQEDRVYWSGFGQPTAEEVRPSYRSMLLQAQKHLGMTECHQGICADDLANMGLYDYLRLLQEHGPEGAIKLARFRLGRNVMDIRTKAGNNPTKSVDQTNDSESLDLDWESIEASRLYFSPDMIDTLSAVLTARELEAIILLFESDLTEKQTAKRMRVQVGTIKTLKFRALEKLSTFFKAQATT